MVGFVGPLVENRARRIGPDMAGDSRQGMERGEAGVAADLAGHAIHG